jgi:RNA polymerase sigma factor (sigma-70 family)
MTDDWTLLDRWQHTRDQQAFDQLVQRHLAIVYNAARRMLGGPGQEAQDVTQAVFLLLSQRAAAIPRRRSLVGWLFRATDYCCRNVRRQEGRRRKHEREAAMGKRETTMTDTAETRESAASIADILDHALARLNEKERSAILIKYLEGKTAAETAAVLNTSPEAVEKRLARGIDKLRQIFIRKGLIVPAAGIVATLSAESAKAAPAGWIVGASAVTSPTGAVAAIAQGATAMMIGTAFKSAIAAALVLLFSLGIAAVVITSQQSPPPSTAATGSATASATLAATSPATAPGGTTIRGIVVDETNQPVPNIAVEILATKSDAPPPHTQTAPDGHFTLTPASDKNPPQYLLARNADGSRQGLGDRSDPAGRGILVNDVKIILKPAREFAITVQDAKGNPIVDATLAATIFPHVIGETRSDAAGRGTLRVPADAVLEYIYAMKPGAGTDYYIFWNKFSTRSDPFHLDDGFAGPLTFVLNGVAPVTVHVQDEEHRPIARVTVTPWYFEKPDKGGDFNPGTILPQLTDDQGNATFSIIPADNSKRVAFWVRHEGFTSPQRWTWDPAAKTSDLTATLVKQIPITGSVLTATGKPAAGATVRVGGAGYQFDDFSKDVTTAPDGSFSLNADPDMFYLFVAQLGHDVSPPVHQVIRREAKPITLVLQPGNLVFGKATAGPQNDPVANTGITLYVLDDSYHTLPKTEQFPGGTIGRKSIAPRVAQYTTTNDQGAFEFFTCLGTVQVDAFLDFDRDIQNFTLADTSKQLRIHFQNATLERPKIHGRVIRAEPPATTVPLAVLTGIPLDFDNHGLVSPAGIADRNGNFEINQAFGDMYLHVAADDGKLAAIALIKPGQDNLTIALNPTTQVTGRLVDAAGKPLSKSTVGYSLVVKGPRGLTNHHLAGKILTRDDGTFTLTGLVPGYTYSLNQITENPAIRYQTLRPGSVDATTQPTHLGDITIAR